MSEFDPLKLFKQMIRRVPAYGEFLVREGFDHRKVVSEENLQSVPLTNKQNYIDKSSLSELCWDGKLEQNDYIVNSSGSTGHPYFWLRNKKADQASGIIYEHLFRHSLRITKPTLIVNSFGQGSWIAGIEAFLASRYANNKGIANVVINSGIDIELILRQLQQLADQFSHIIFIGYPPFIKDLFELLHSKQIITAKHEVSVIVGGESISEPWRSYVSGILAIGRPVPIFSIYGMSDGGGIMAFETPSTKVLRAYISDTTDASGRLSYYFGGKGNTALFQYNPALRYFVPGPNGQLLIHVKHGLPLFNYDTKDQGGIVKFSEVSHKFSKIIGTPKSMSSYPFVYLSGRSDNAVTFYGLNIYPEHIRAIIDRLMDQELTGRFVMEKNENGNMNQQLNIKVEICKRINKLGKNEKLKHEKWIESFVYEKLSDYNSEYAKLVSSVGSKAKLTIELCEFGSLGYVIGKKHQWVKKN